MKKMKQINEKEFWGYYLIAFTIGVACVAMTKYSIFLGIISLPLGIYFLNTSNK